MSLSAIALIAEAKIAEAAARGELDNLPGSGKPLETEDLSLAPEELRMAYKILKNSGYLPREIADRKEAGAMLKLAEDAKDEQERIAAIKRLKTILQRMERGNERLALLGINDEYYLKILAKLEKREREQGGKQASGASTHGQGRA